MFFFNGIYVPNLQLSFFGFLMYFFIILSQIFTKILIKLAYICFDSNICKHGAIDPAQNKFSVSPEFSVSSENIFHNSQIYLVLYLCGQVQQIKEYELKFWYQRIVQIPGFSFNSYTTMNIFLIYQRFFFFPPATCPFKFIQRNINCSFQSFMGKAGRQPQLNSHCNYSRKQRKFQKILNWQLIP